MSGGSPAKPGQVEIVEVSPRDGLQNEPAVLATQDKRQLVEDMIAAGARRIEVASFVRADLVPQMANPEELLARLRRPDGVSLIGLVLNGAGAQRAAAVGIDELNYVVPASDEFGVRNQGATTAEAVRRLAEVGRIAERAGIRLSVTIAVAFGCPYTGEVPAKRVAAIARDVQSAAQLDELALADTIGSGIPGEVTERFAAVARLSAIPLRAHFHDTRRTGIANALAALAAGASALDASAAGLGGCPFAPGAAGNVATEDLAWALARGGWQTGLDIAAIVAGGARVCERLGIAPRSGLASAGAFP